MRRRAGEAADLILRTLIEADARALTLTELGERSGLANSTVHDNVKQLCKSGRLQASTDGHGTVWVSLCEAR